MSLATTTSIIQYSPNGVTTVFAYPYYFLDKTHLFVILTVAGVDSTPYAVDTHYTVAGVGVPAGGSLTFGVAPPAGSTLTIYRDVPITQLVDYVVDDNFPAETHEQALDKLTMICQALSEYVLRTHRAPLSDPALPPAKGLVLLTGIAACIDGVDTTISVMGKIES